MKYIFYILAIYFAYLALKFIHIPVAVAGCLGIAALSLVCAIFLTVIGLKDGDR